MYAIRMIDNILKLVMIKCGRDESELEQWHGGGREGIFWNQNRRIW